MFPSAISSERPWTSSASPTASATPARSSEFRATRARPGPSEGRRPRASPPLAMGLEPASCRTPRVLPTTELLVWQRSQLLRLPRDQQHKREPCLPQFAKALLRGRRQAGGTTLAASKTRERDMAPEPCPVFPGFIQLSWFIRCPRKSKSAITPGLATAWCHRHDLPTAALDRENGGDWLVNGGMRPGRKTTERKCSSRRSRARVCSTSLGTAARGWAARQQRVNDLYLLYGERESNWDRFHPERRRGSRIGAMKADCPISGGFACRHEQQRPTWTWNWRIGQEDVGAGTAPC